MKKTTKLQCVQYLPATPSKQHYGIHFGLSNRFLYPCYLFVHKFTHPPLGAYITNPLKRSCFNLCQHRVLVSCQYMDISNDEPEVNVNTVVVFPSQPVREAFVIEHNLRVRLFLTCWYVNLQSVYGELFARTPFNHWMRAILPLPDCESTKWSTVHALTFSATNHTKGTLQSIFSVVWVLPYKTYADFHG